MGKTFEAVVEGFDKWAECYFGRTESDAPDIDGKVFSQGPTSFESDNMLILGLLIHWIMT